MIVKSLHKNFIEAELATGKGRGKRYFLPNELAISNKQKNFLRGCTQIF
jgi:hypothetical protein